LISVNENRCDLASLYNPDRGLVNIDDDRLLAPSEATTMTTFDKREQAFEAKFAHDETRI
jgi:hypothetical protein